MREKHVRTALLTPTLIVMAATIIYPFLAAFLLSFQEWRMSRSARPTAFVGLENYARAFADANFINSAVVTVEYTILSVALSVALGLAIALLLQKRSLINSILRTFLIFPFAMAPVLKGYTWRFMLHPQFGIIDRAIDAIFPPAQDIVWLGHPFWALFWLAMTEVWGWAPYIALVFIGALETLPAEVFDAAKVDGASKLQSFRHVTIPLLMPIIVMVTLLKTIFSVKQFDAVVSLTGGGPGRATETINFFVYQTGFKYFDMGYAAALAYLLVIAMFVLAFFYVRFLLRGGPA